MNNSIAYCLILLTVFIHVKIVSSNGSDLEDSPVSPTGIIFELPEETVQAEKSRWAKLKTYMPTVSFNCFVTAGIKLKWGGYALENKIGFDENNYKFITNIQRKTESFWTTVNLSPTGDYSVQMQVHTAQGPGYFIYNLKPNEVNDTFVKLYNDAKAVRGTYSEKLFQKAGIVKEKLGAGGVILLSKFTSLLKKPAKIENVISDNENAGEIKSAEATVSKEKSLNQSRDSFKTASQGSLENSDENKPIAKNIDADVNLSKKVKKVEKSSRKKRIILRRSKLVKVKQNNKVNSLQTIREQRYLRNSQSSKQKREKQD